MCNYNSFDLYCILPGWKWRFTCARNMYSKTPSGSKNVSIGARIKYNKVWFKLIWTLHRKNRRSSVEVAVYSVKFWRIKITPLLEGAPYGIIFHSVYIYCITALLETTSPHPLKEKMFNLSIETVIEIWSHVCQLNIEIYTYLNIKIQYLRISFKQK